MSVPGLVGLQILPKFVNPLLSEASWQPTSEHRCPGKDARHLSQQEDLDTAPCTSGLSCAPDWGGLPHIPPQLSASPQLQPLRGRPGDGNHDPISLAPGELWAPHPFLWAVQIEN